MVKRVIQGRILAYKKKALSLRSHTKKLKQSYALGLVLREEERDLVERNSIKAELCERL